MAEDRYDDDDEHQPQRGVVFDLGANEVTEFSNSPFASREVTPDGPMFAGAGDFAPMGAEFEAGKTMQYARMLGMDIVRDSEFVWIADEMARAELPPGWAEVAAKGGGIAFLDTSTQIVSDEHPTASYYRKLFERHKSESGRGDTPPQPSLEALEARLGAQKGGDGVAGDGAAGDGDGSGDSDSSLDSDDSDYEERLARRRARSRRRRSSGSSGGSTPDDDSDSDKENDASRRIRARERKAERKSVRQQIMEKAEQKSAAPVKRKTARDRVMDKAAEMSADAATQEATVREDRPAAGGAQQGAEELDAMDLNQRAAGRVKERHKRAPVAESDSDEDTVRLREEQKAAKAKREQKQKQRESLVTAKERRQIEKVALRREREAKKARKRQEEEEEEGQEQQEKARAAHKKEKFRRGMEEEYQSKTEEFRESYAKDHPVAVKKRKEKQTEEERRRREEEEAMRRAQETADLAAGEAERARLAKELRKEQRRQKRAMMAGYNENENAGGREDPNGRRRKKRGHRRRADEEELQVRQEEEWRQHAELMREEEEAKEKEKARRRKQAELEAALEAMREVFGQDRDEKLLTIWLAEAMHDVAAAINIGLAHDQKAEEQRQKEADRPDTPEDPVDAALDGIALKLAETTHAKAAEHADEEDMDPEEREALEALKKEMEEFDSALDTHSKVETAEEKRARKEDRRRKKQAAKEAKRAAAAAASGDQLADGSAPQEKAKKKLSMFGRMFGKKKKKADEEEEGGTAAATSTPTVDDDDPAAAAAAAAATGPVDDITRPRSRSPDKLRSGSNRSGRSSTSGGSEKDDSGGLAVGDPCEVYSQSQEKWVAGSVTEVGYRQVAVEYGERARAIDLADVQLSDYFRAPNLQPLKPLRSSSIRSNLSSPSRDPRDVRFEVGDAVEMYSESQGAWIAGVIIEIKRNKIAVEYGDRMRVVDLGDPKLSQYFKSKRLRSDSRRSRTPQFNVGDPCEVYSRSGEKWEQGVVTEVGRRKIAVEYGDRTRAIDLTDPELASYFRAPNLKSGSSVYGLFVVGDAVEMYSQSQEAWVKGAVIEVKGQKVAVEYGDRMRVVDLADPQLKSYFRSDKLQLAASSDVSEMSKQSDMGSKQGGTGLAAILRQDPNSAFAIARQKLQAKKQEIDAMETQGFKGVAAKAVDRAKKEAEVVAADFWSGGPKLQQKPEATAAADADAAKPQLADKSEDAADGKEDKSVPTKSDEGVASLKSPSYSTDDPVLANAKSLLAAMPDLDALQRSLLSRSTPSVFHSDSEDDELTAEAGSRPVSREATALAVVPVKQGARVRDIHVPDEATLAAKAAMTEQRSKIDSMLRVLEDKAKADDEILRAESAVVIQMAYRRHLLRCRVRRAVKMAQMRKRESVRKIWRGWQYRKRRTAAREWRKSLWEVRRAEKKALVIHQKRQAVAARSIQACFRGYLVREGHPTFGDPRVGRMSEAAKVFQKYWAGKFERRRKAIYIQAVWRGYWCRKTVKPGMDVLTQQRSQAALMIQGRQRIKIAKQEQTKRVIAILVLQRGMKRYYDAKMAKSSVLQKAYRRRLEAKKRHAYFILRRLIWTNLHVRGLEEVKNAHLIQAAVTMQRMTRGKMQKNEFLIKKAAVLRIQRNYRGKLGRAQYQVLNNQRYKERGEKFLWAVERLQACFRGKRMRRNMHGYFLQVASVVRIQRTWRGFKCRHDMFTAVERWCASMAIQSATRFFLFRRRARLSIHRREFLAKKAKDDAEALYFHQIVTIQSRFRGNKGRKIAEAKWRALNDEFAECYRINRAIVRIQRSWRAHDAHRRAYALAARIAAAIIVQKAWRQHLNHLQQSQEWSKRYNPLHGGMPDEVGSRSGSAGSRRSAASSAPSPAASRPKRGGSASTVQSAAQSAAQTVTDSVHSVMSDGLSEHAREERDAARIEQNLWVREHLNVQTIWMKDESQVAANRESDSNMAQFFYKRAKPLAAVRCLESALRQQPPTASVATRCTININIATVLSQLNEFQKASDVLESSIGLLVADVKAQERVEGERRGSDSQSARETAVPKNSERSFALTALAVCYHNLSVQKLFLDAPAAAIACAAAAMRLTADTKCLASKHPWLARMERTVEAARQYQEEGGMRQALSPRPVETSQPSAAAYKATSKTPFGPFHDAPRETGKKKGGGAQSKRGRAANMRASIKQQKAGRRGKGGKVSPPPPAGAAGGPAKKRNGKPARGKRNSMPTAGPRGGGGFPGGRPGVERLPYIDPEAPPSVLRHSGREETMGDYSESVTAREDEEAAARQNKWSYLDSSDNSRVQKPRALRRVAPTRGRTPPEFAGRPVRGGSAGSARGARQQQNSEDDVLDHRGRFVSR